MAHADGRGRMWWTCVLVLALAACGGEPPALTPTAEAPLGPATSVVTAADGMVVTFWGGTEGGGATVRDGRTGAVVAEVAAPPGPVDLAFPSGDDLVLAGPVESDAGPGYALRVADPGTGEVTEVRPVTPYPAGSVDWGSFAVLTGPGQLVVTATSGYDCPPALVQIDPATGSVIRTVPVSGGIVDTSEQCAVLGLAVSPEGARLAVALDLFELSEPDPADSLTAVALVYDAELEPVGPPIVLGDSLGGGEPFGFAVGDDGTVTAAALQAVVTARPGDPPRDVVALRAPVADLVVADGSAWVLYRPHAPDHEPSEPALHRIDLDDGEVTGTAEACGTGDLASAPDGATVYLADRCGEGAALRSFPAG